MKRLFLLVLCVFLLSACSNRIQNAGTQTTVTTDDSPISTTASTTDATEPISTIATTVPETIPPKASLSIESGAHLMRYKDENSGNYMDYYLFVPHNATVDMPIIVFLHGIYQVGQPESLKNYAIVNCVKDIYGEDFPFLLLLPSTHIYSWTTYDVPYTLHDLVDTVASAYEADRDRIIITGHSLGAIGTWKMVSLYGDFFAAVVPVSCGSDEALDYENFLDVPVWGFVGNSGDDELRYGNGMQNIASAIRDAGGNAKITVIDGATHLDMSTMPYTQELFDWMLAQ